MNILIVDDEALAVRGILQCIDWEAQGFDHIYVAYSVREAAEIFSSRTVQMLLTDIEMQDGTGFDLIQKMNEKKCRYVSIILSGFPNFSYAQRAITLGVTEYLLKPVENSMLIAALQKAMKIYRQQELLPVGEGMDAQSEDLIERARAYIADHLSTEISRSDLAAYIGFNPEYLSTYFKKKTGLTLSEYIRNERIDFAKRLLTQTNLPISVISENVGFESLSYFSSVFRQLIGCTPREYRRNGSETGT